MDRRAFLGRMALGLVAVPVAVDAQQPAKVARIGYLGTGPLESPEQRSVFDAFREGMRELGYVEGQNIVIEHRDADGKIERFPALARELVGLKVDVILAINSLAGRAVRQATTTIPTVVPVMGDPIGDGLVASLARPGGNITGLAFIGPQLVPKRLELLKEALPGVSRVAGLWHPGAYAERTVSDMLKEAEAAARTLGLQLRLVAVRRPDELGRAFGTIAGARADALLATRPIPGGLATGCMSCELSDNGERIREALSEPTRTRHFLTSDRGHLVPV